MPVAGDDGTSKWKCPICSEELGSDHDFTVHIRSHNTVQTKTANSCTICGKVLSSQSSLDRHMLVHSGKGLCTVLCLANKEEEEEEEEDVIFTCPVKENRTLLGSLKVSDREKYTCQAIECVFFFHNFFVLVKIYLFQKNYLFSCD
jgi:uncharacterized Zn-finger protein